MVPCRANSSRRRSTTTTRSCLTTRELSLIIERWPGLRYLISRLPIIKRTLQNEVGKLYNKIEDGTRVHPFFYLVGFYGLVCNSLLSSKLCSSSLVSCLVHLSSILELWGIFLGIRHSQREAVRVHEQGDDETRRLLYSSEEGLPSLGSGWFISKYREAEDIIWKALPGVSLRLEGILDI